MLVRKNVRLILSNNDKKSSKTYAEAVAVGLPVDMGQIRECAKPDEVQKLKIMGQVLWMNASRCILRAGMMNFATEMERSPNPLLIYKCPVCSC